MENQNVRGDKERCHRRDGKTWRCKNPLSTSHNPSYYCDKHYNSAWYINSNSRRRGRRKLVGAAHHSSDEIQFKRQKIGITENKLKRQRVEKTAEKTDDQLKKGCSEEEEVRSLEEEEEGETKKCETKLETVLGVCKNKCVELQEELEKKSKECVAIQGKIGELESMKVAEEEELEEELNSRQETKRNLDGRVTYLEAELKKMEKDKEHEKRRAEEEIEFWRNKVFDLEARVLRVENRSLESRISEPRGLRNDAPHVGEKGGYNELSKRDAAFNGGRQCSRLYEIQIKVDNEVGECSANSISSGIPKVPFRGQNDINDENDRLERASVYESSSKNLLGSSAELHGNTAAVKSVELVCLISDEESAGEASKENSGCSSDSESLGEVMEKMAAKYRNKVKDMKWEFEADMLSSFEEDPELCMKAICALYRQQTFEAKSANMLFHQLDAFRIKTLAEFLMEEDCRGDLKKSMKELEAFTPKALDDCKRLANTYSKQLFSIYKDNQDPFFCPTSTTSL